MKRMWIAAGMVLVWAGISFAADLRLAVVFSDHMVLQRDKPVPVWGWGDPGEKLTVAFAGQSKPATAGPDGKWSVTLDPMPATARPGELVVTSAQPGRAARAEDVLVGEVWLGSGQSNMAMTVGRSRDAEAEQAAANHPRIRMFKEASASADAPRADAAGEWTVCSPETVAGFSAVLYFFGREIHRELDVPVGLINSSVGGTPIEAWIDAAAQASDPRLKAALDAAAERAASVDEAAVAANHEQAMARWKTAAAEARKEGRPVPRAPRNPLATLKRKGDIGGLFNGKIAPLIPYAIRGALWYQGEANAHPDKGPLYRIQLPLLVTDWRARWGEELPFAWAQLPNFERDGEDWMLVREAMLLSLRLPKTGMAVTLDIGDPKDIHPTNKQDVGRRMALWALGAVYGRPVPAVSGPLPAGHEVRGGAIVVSFRHADGGLKAGEGGLKGFVVAGEDRQWKPATARIEGDAVIVSSPDVPAPVAVRYAWAANPEAALFNGAGLPASPFRTDDWTVPSLGQETP